MPTMINLGKEMLRISLKDSKKLEYSTTQGRSWILHYPGNNSIGNFQDLMDAALAPLCTLSSGTAYIIQFVDSPTDQMRVEEMAAVTEWLSSYQDGKDVTWGVSRRSTQEDSICIHMAVGNLQMKI